MSKVNILREFVENYLNLNDVDFTIDKNKIYHVKFKDVLMNKLGRVRKFSFSRSIADDYGVDYISLNSEIVKFFLRDSISKGKIIKAKLKIPYKIEKNNKLKEFNIKEEEQQKETGIAFLFKISSTDSNFEDTPEALQYVVLDYENMKIIESSFSEEFHNLILEDSKFKFDNSDLAKAHSVAYEYLENQIQFKYGDNEEANKLEYKNRTNELENRHQSLKKDCDFEEKDMRRKISIKEDRIRNSRTFEAENKYKKELENLKIKLDKIEQINRSRILEHFEKTKLRIDEEKSKYIFNIDVSLLSAVVFQYDVKKLTLFSGDKKANGQYNELTKDFIYFCPICENESSEPILSIEGNFCCKNCSEYDNKKKVYYCEKDNVQKCPISGKFIERNKENLCCVSNKYYDKSFMVVDNLEKPVCQMYVKKTPYGAQINQNDAISIRGQNYSPNEVGMCEYSKNQYPKDELILTTGSNKRIYEKYLKKCKVTKLTFSPNEVKGDTSNLVSMAKEVPLTSIKIKAIKEKIRRNEILFNENNNWAYACEKKLIGFNRYLYDKKKRVLKKL